MSKHQILDNLNKLSGFADKLFEKYYDQDNWPLDLKEKCGCIGFYAEKNGMLKNMDTGFLRYRDGTEDYINKIFGENAWANIFETGLPNTLLACKERILKQIKQEEAK